MTNKQPQYDETFKKNIVALHQNGKTQTELSKGIRNIGKCDLKMDKALFGSQGRRQYCYDSKADKGTTKKKRTA